MTKLDQTKFEEEQRVLRLWTQQLYREYDVICYRYGLKLKPVVIQIKPLQSTWGQWCSLTRHITMSEGLIKEHAWTVIIEVLKHEMAHQYVSEVMKQSDQHGLLFQEAAKICGVESWAAKAQVDLKDAYKSHSEEVPDEERKLLRWMEKLLALASSAEEHEAKSALQKVRQLSRKYQLNFESRHQSCRFYSTMISHEKKRISQFQCLICDLISRHFMVQVIYTNLYNPRAMREEKAMEIMGEWKNVQVAEYVYWFLYNNIMMKWREQKKSPHFKGLKARNSFCEGMVQGFRESLDHSEEQEITEHDYKKSQHGLVLAKFEKELDHYVRFRHPRTHSVSRSSRVGHRKGYEAGKRAGKQLKLYHGLGARNQTIRGYLKK